MNGTKHPAPRFECLLIEPGQTAPAIEPASRRRGWMDAMSDAHAYRCLPLVIANQHGWQILCGGEFEAVWTGGDARDDVEIRTITPGQPSGSAHFGYGVLTFEINVILRTPPGLNLWVSGPANSFKDGVQALSAVIETDWMPFTFTMNWKFTRAEHRVRFEPGEPICQLFPVPRGLAEELDPVIATVERDRNLQRRFANAKLRRTAPRIQRALAGEDDGEKEFQRWYIKGEQPDGTGIFEDHQKHLDIRPFRHEPE